MSTNLPDKRIKKIKLPGDIEGSQTYEIIPEKLQSNGFQASLPTLTEDSTIALTGDVTVSQTTLPGTASRPETTTTSITVDGTTTEIKSYTKIDSSLSSSSKNPVANDIIYNAISNKVEAEDFQELEQIALTTLGVLTGEPLTPVLSITDGNYYPTVSDSGSRWKMGKADSATFYKIYNVSGYTSVHLTSVSRAGHILTDTAPSDFNTKIHQNPTSVANWYEATSVSDSEQADVLPKTGYTPYDKDLTINGKHYLIVYEVNAAQAIEVINGGGYSPIYTSMFVNDGDGTTSGDVYAKLSDLPAAQVNSDWNASSGVAEILHKPTLATVATSGDYDDLINTPSEVIESTVSGWGFTKNEGTVTSVNNTAPVNGNVTLHIPSPITITTTSGSESISDGTNTINTVTRNTNQTISGSWTFNYPAASGYIGNHWDGDYDNFVIAGGGDSAPLCLLSSSDQYESLLKLSDSTFHTYAAGTYDIQFKKGGNATTAAWKTFLIIKDDSGNTKFIAQHYNKGATTGQDAVQFTTGSNVNFKLSVWDTFNIYHEENQGMEFALKSDGTIKFKDGYNSYISTGQVYGNTSTLFLNSNDSIEINTAAGSGTAYYKGTAASNELATKGDISTNYLSYSSTAVSSGSTKNYILGKQTTSSNSSTYYNSNVYFTNAGELTVNTLNLLSDARLKENLAVYNPSKSILDLPVYTFDFKDSDLKNQIGCLAQDLQEIEPRLVDATDDGYLHIRETKLVYLLLNEVKKLNNKINDLTTELTNLKSEE